MGDLQPWPPLLDGTYAIGDDGGGGGGTDDGINAVDIDRGGGGDGFPVAMEDNHPPAVQPPQAPNPLPSAIADENWQRAEEATREVLRCILPTVASEQRRKAVMEYVQKVLKVGIEVYPFGSVPLKTYLPDGDIDLTAMALPNTEDILAKDVYSFLEVEEHNKCSEFEVKDVQFIHAEVKLVKCIVQNIVVDVSFNQIGGLSTLCFLEKADQYIGKDNLFKRSIVLIKAWCYYESRILGAHHGLISTYALETLVLYIFHLFHNSLNDPLVVLYRFLDFYSKFDWDNYCVSLYGPVLVSSLPDLIVEPPETDGTDLLFSKDFIKECADIFSVPSRGLDTNSRVFPQKHLNIVDPLKQNNNLGRSVSKGNFYRIRSAFTYGARKLGRILLLPLESIPDEVSLFFTNTLHRHGTRERPDVQDARPSFSDNGTTHHIRVNSLPSHLQVENGYDMMSISSLAISDVNGASTEETNGVNISDIQEHETRLQVNKNSLNLYLDVSNGSCLPNDIKLEPKRIIERETVSDAHLSDDARNLASTRVSTPRIMGETVKTSGKNIHAPHFFFQAETSSGDENIDNRNSRDDTLNNAVLNRTGAVADEPRYETVPSSSTSWFINDTVLSPTSNIHLSPSSSCMSEDSNFVDSSNDAKENIKGATSQNLADLSGNHHFHFMNLMYAQNSQETIINPYYNIQPLSPSHYQSKHPWNSFHQRNIFSHVGTNVLLPGNSFSPSGSYLPNKPALLAYSTKDIQTTRGTGTYFPNTNSRSYRERQQTGRGKNQMLANNFQRTRYYGRNETLQDRGFVDEGNGEQSPRPQTSSFGGSGHVKAAPLEFTNSRYPPFKGVPHGNGFAYPTEGKLEFGTLGAIAIGVPSPEHSDISEQGSSISQDSGSRIIPSTLQKPSTSFNHERPAQPYQLKDEEDFPPLTG